MKINSMIIERAKLISNWIYEEPYSMYSFDGSEQCISELMDSSYFCVFDDCEEFIGYVCYGHSARVPAGFDYGAYNRNNVIDIGLGLRPDLCSKGIGLLLIKAGLDYAKEFYKNDKFRLTVATFNKRAIKIYEKAGFFKDITFVKESDLGSIEFRTMVRE